AFAQSPGKPVANRLPLKPNAYNLLPLGAVEPRGWLRKQLEIQAGGLTGHLDEFWKDVGSNSGWLGGTGESWERGPYYLDGLLPLAYELQDQRLIEKAKRWVEWTLTHQQPDGQIGPPRNDDWWPRMVMLKVLTQYQEATGDSRVIPLMTKYFAYELRELPKRPLRSWGKYRWQDNALSVIWLYNRTGDRSLLQLLELLHQGGYDWASQFANFRYTGKQSRGGLKLAPNTELSDAAMQTHGVNNAMALKEAPVCWLLSGNNQDRRAFDRQLEALDRYQGLPNGMFSGDEHFAGIDPSQGIELCAVVESMFSYEVAFSALGDPRIADRLEKVTFNALPATISNDMWSHQYDQQPNQIACTRAPRQWSTNNDDSNLFGLEPNFGCCTANLHQGWPKFVSSLWMATGDNGLLASAYAPNQVRTQVNGVDVRIEENTEYPFRNTVRFTLHPAQPVTFGLHLRLPGWAKGATVAVNGQSSELPQGSCRLIEGNSPQQTSCNFAQSFHTISRNWKDGDTVSLTFQTEPRITHWYHDAAVFEWGPLVFSLPIEAQWSELKHYAQQSSDWQLQPKSDWKYAVALGPCDARMAEGSSSDVPFDVKHPAITMRVQARQLPQWTVQENSAGPVPLSPVNSESLWQELTLVPYGAAKLRITAFPYLREKSKCQPASATAGGL
ncbi:MAG: glycoside hydrolase family 127 protein, partial [Acidobacteriaceae bacterium]|nr:glycoside hydrolase family 127 protein [Acidobacteriaceae bacterium]